MAAIDWHFTHWMAKPVAFVSYGGMSGGRHAVLHLENVLSELHAVTSRHGRGLPVTPL
ncbi:NADPH-dependent FMN reductase [Plantactinospora siamensis]|uniref:NADPH-dependent FMN reductase n=1 Tax=Plantactinospora siamensis TaxID=555372 RepID=A0ABV6P1V9_9ACTN